MVNLYSLVFIQVVSWHMVSCEWSFSPDLEHELAQVNIEGVEPEKRGDRVQATGLASGPSWRGTRVEER